MIDKMIIRNANVDDAMEMKALHERSVLELCRFDYTPEQLKGWIKNNPLEKYQNRLEHHRSFIVEIDGKMVGYVRWNPETNELCSIFVHPDHVRQGIATKLMEKTYEDIRTFGVKELWLDASLTAVPFYETEGWEFIEKKMHGSLACVRMIKRMDDENF
jgi:putative acetyltransferase